MVEPNKRRRRSLNIMQLQHDMGAPASLKDAFIVSASGFNIRPREVMQQEPSQMMGIDLIYFDHHNVEQMYKKFRMETDEAARRNLVRKIIGEICKHSAMEEQVLYPIISAKFGRTEIRSRRPDPWTREFVHGETMTRACFEDHFELKMAIIKLLKMNPKYPSFIDQFQLIMGMFRSHVDLEELEVLPLLERHLSSEQNSSLGRTLAGFKSSAPDTPILNSAEKSWIKEQDSKNYDAMIKNFRKMKVMKGF